MKRAYSIRNVLDARFKTLDFDGEWLSAVGRPQLGGSWMIYGAPKNGKTSLAMKLARYMTRFCRVAYDSVEEGLSLSIQNCVERTFGGEGNQRFLLLNKESVEELTERLARRSSPDVVVIDSVQFMGLHWEEYKQLKERFPHKLFIYISHVDGNLPEGRVARKIWRDADVYIRVEGFRGFPVGRYMGGEPIDVDAGLAERYWSMQNN
jgi:hypothetical protein